MYIKLHDYLYNLKVFSYSLFFSQTPDGQLGLIITSDVYSVLTYKIPYEVIEREGLTTPPKLWDAWEKVEVTLVGDFMRRGSDQLLIIFNQISEDY